ncbi:MAG: NAD(P)-binding domain-containing protein [Ginsengibacter sp.]
MKKIGILGSGAVAQALAVAFTKNGDEVKLGTGHPEKLSQWNEENGNKSTIGSFKDAAMFGDIIVLAVKGTAAETVLKEAGTGTIKGKTIIDTTNPIDDAPPVHGVLKFYTDINYSLMEKLQTVYPEANFVKAFNSIGNGLMYQPDFDGVKPSMFICGNSGDAKKEVSEILTAFGFETEDMGSAEAARAIEPLCMLWCIPGLSGGSWEIAFKLLKK